MAASAILIFWALVLTNSRSGLLGMAASLTILAILLGIKNLRANLKLLLILFAVFAIISFSFANLITSRIKDTLQNAPRQEQAEKDNSNSQSSPTSGGTESGQIRLIVWQGALEVFKKWPALGPGPETFVNTYYLYRPSAQNQTSEWEFFYNKAHNEFLNYLATSGIIGLLGFVTLCTSIVISALKFNKADKFARNFQRATVVAVVGYLVTIFFGFSTVANQTTLFLAGALAITLGGQGKIKNFGLKYLDIPACKSAQIALILITFTYTLTLVGRIYFADSLTSRAQNLEGTRALLALRNAITASPIQNPYLLADFAYNTATYANTQQNRENKDVLIREVKKTANTVLTLAPNNFLTTQKIAKSYILIIEDEEAAHQARSLALKLPELAPTYPPAYLVSAQIYVALEEKGEARRFAQKSLELKSDYLEAQKLLGQLTI